MDQHDLHLQPAGGAPQKPSLQRKWSRLTDEDLERVEGDPATLADCLHERYGYSSERALAESRHFFQTRSRTTDSRPGGVADPADAEASYGLGRTGESRGREVPGDRDGHPGDSSETEARAARRG